MDVVSARLVLAESPGDAQFVELAEHLRQKHEYQEALHVCLAGLSANPSEHRGRLLLSRLFYEQGFYPFAICELEKLAATLPENTAIAKLLEKLNPNHQAKQPSGGKIPAEANENIVAETDFDLSVLDSLEHETK